MLKWIICIIFLFVCSCNQTNDIDSGSNTTFDEFKNVFSQEKPENFISVSQVRKEKPGSEVRVFGRIMGNKAPFTENRASFIIADPSVLSVCQDACGYPWDCCCDDKNTISQATLSIQILNDDKQVIKSGLKGKNGLKELSEVIVFGEIDNSSTDKFMIINAKQIHVVQ